MPKSEVETPLNPQSALAIVGIGCLFPKAAHAGYFWANVKNGVDGITDVPATHWNPDDYFDADPKSPDRTYARRGGFLDVVDFNPIEFGLPPKDLEATDTSQLLGLVAAKQALVDAGIVFGDDKGQVDRSKVSVILGVTGTLELVIPLGARLGHPHWKRALKDSGVPDDVAAEVIDRIGEAYVPWQENSFPGLLGNVVAGRIANKLDLHGTNCVVDAACASSLSALHLAAMELQTGKADVAVTGGVDTFNDIFMYMCFSKTPALSPTGDSRPFEANGDGTILGEGLGMVVLKRLADAERDGDRIYAVLRGLGTSSDGKGNAIYAPSADGQKRCLVDAYTRAGVSPQTVELVEAHGTGTKVGDAVEAKALTEVFRGEAVASVALGSVKSMIGHTKAAAGSASLIKTALALYNKVLPPTLKVTKPVAPLDAADSPFYVNAKARPWLPRAEHPRRAGLSAFGFGGSNFHAVLEEHSPRKVAPDWDGTVEILALSAATVDKLQSELAKLPTAWTAFAMAAEASRTSFDVTAPCRLLFAAQRDVTDLAKVIRTATEQLARQPDAKAWSTPDGVHFGRGPTTGKLAILFPGQGSQTVNMLRDLTCLFPEMLDTLAAANLDFKKGTARLSDLIYPPTRYGEELKRADDAALRATDAAQPALGAVSFGAWMMLAGRFGLQADAFAGHSYGELPALAAAGVYGPGELFTLSRRRGELMAAPREGDPGSMLAVLAPLEQIERTIAEAKLNLVIANHNSPSQFVLSGPTLDIEKAVDAFRAKNVRTVRLSVAAAFHSTLVADAATPFRETLEGIEFKAAVVPVFANTTAAEYPADTAAAKDLLGHQLAKPVDFTAEIRALARIGVRTFLEVGPGSTLTKLVEAILEGDANATEYAGVALEASAGRKSGTYDLANALGRLAARGHAVTLSAWEAGSRCRPQASTAKPGLTVPICGANYVMPRSKKPPRTTPVIFAESTPMAAPSDDPVQQALAASQATLATLQQLQAQTASLHKQFLDSQEQAQRTLAQLVNQQAAMFGGGSLPTTVSMPAPAPANRPIIRPAPIPDPLQHYAATPVVISPPVPRVTSAPTPALRGSHSSPPAKSGVIASTLIAVVSEKTGYPIEMLDLSMSLDADLGIDSIKRVEILSAIQEKLPNAPVVKPEHLGTLVTLQHVVNFLSPGSNGLVEDIETTVTMPIETLQRDVLAHLPHPNTYTQANVPVESLGRGALQSDSVDTIVLPDSFGPTSSVRLATPGTANIADVLLSVVAEKTGYPIEMLDLGMSLDADLGIDSIKRVEILSGMQEKLPDAPHVKPEHLGSLTTLQDVIDFLAGSMSRIGPLTQKISIAPLSHFPGDSDSRALDLISKSDSTLSHFGAPKTEPFPNLRTRPGDSGIGMLSGMATPVVSPGLMNGDSRTFVAPPPRMPLNEAENVERSIVQAVDVDTGSIRPRVPFPEGGEFWLVADDEPIAQEMLAQLVALRFTAKRFNWTSLATAKSVGNIAGLILLAPQRVPPGMPFNRLAFQWVQTAGHKLRGTARHSAAACIVSIARLDGAFGLISLAPTADPLSGGLAGLIKTVKHEWPELAVKAIDLNPSLTEVPTSCASAIVEEILALGPLEVGISPTHRCTLELARTVRRTTSMALSFSPKDVILVTGGGRGVTAEAAIGLAETYRATMVLTGRTAAPTAPEPEWAVGKNDEVSLKAAAALALGSDTTPKAIAEVTARLIAQREIRETLKRIEAAGAKAAYFAVNVAQGRAVADLLHQVKVKYGPITGLVHGAGVLADRRLENLTPEQFDYVFNTKVDGAKHLFDLLGGEDLKAVVLFGSTTGRFGRVGQTAYAAANEVLNKMAQVEARKRPNARVVCINWGPWEGGMVTPALRKVFEHEGIGLIPLADGAAFLVHELNASGRSVEVVALGSRPRSSNLPSPMSPGVSAPLPVPAAPPSTNPPPDMVLAFERTVDVATHPILKSHVLDGRAVLPMAVHMEWLAHAALHGNPGLVFHGFNDLRITHGVMIEDGASSSLRLMAGKAVKQDKVFSVHVELRGRRRDGRDVIHSRAEVILAASLPKAPMVDKSPTVQPYSHPLDEIYKYFLFHGPELHGVESIDGLSDNAFIGNAYPAPAPSEWFDAPLRSGWVTDPLVLDTSFQMMILWSFAQHGAGSLPCFLGRYRQYRRAYPATPVKVVVRVNRDNGSFARADIDYLDAEGAVIAQVQDYECVIDPGLNQAFRRNQLGPAVKA
ncbi:hypothetical protein BH11PLA2_BH11PLA2_15790 [soil metagenome]